MAHHPERHFTHGLARILNERKLLSQLGYFISNALLHVHYIERELPLVYTGEHYLSCGHIGAEMFTEQKLFKTV